MLKTAGWNIYDGGRKADKECKIGCGEMNGCGLTIKQMPEEQRPREKMALLGAGALSDAELVAILLRTGTAQRSALAIAAELTAGGGLYGRLAAAERISDLSRYKGLGTAKAATLLAALELGRRLATAKARERAHFTCPEDAYEYLAPRLRYAAREQFVVVLLNRKNHVISVERISEGTESGALVTPADVFRTAVLQNAAALVAAHNHPSGDPAPSPEDMQLTELMRQAGLVLSIPLIDHIIIGDASYYSFKEQGRLRE